MWRNSANPIVSKAPGMSAGGFAPIVALRFQATCCGLESPVSLGSSLTTPSWRIIVASERSPIEFSNRYKVAREMPSSTAALDKLYA